MALVGLDEPGVIGEVGGKAASLMRLVAAGLRVPSGFVVTSEEDLKDSNEILAGFDALDAPFVAVRSSAVNEDGDQAAWAGQLETYLNVTRGSLLEHIQKCMRSASSARAKVYAEQKQLATGSVAVIVQAMVDSEVSGVAFSVHPVTNDAAQMVVEAGLGLGEAVVNGSITPDMYVLDAATGTVAESAISTQNKRLVREATGGTTWEHCDPPVDTPKLSPDQLTELWQAVRRIAELYGHAVDVEWAFAGGTLYILQARPVTTV